MKNKIVVMCLLCSMLLIGCANSYVRDDIPTTEMNNNQNAIQSSDSESGTANSQTEYKNTNGKVTFDGEIFFSSLDNLFTYNASLQKLDLSKVEGDLLEEEKDYDSYSDKMEDEYGNTNDITYYMNIDDGFFLWPGPNSSNFNYMRGDSNFTNYASAFRLEKKFDDYNADLYSTEEDLSFASRQEAYSQIEDFLKALGLDSDYEYVSYSLEHSLLQSEEIHYDMDGNVDPSENKDEWTQEDDSYYFAIRQVFNGVPVYYPYVNTFVNEDVENYPINAMVNESGIFSLNIDQIFNFINEEKIESVAEFDVVFDSISGKYNDVLGDSTYYFNYAELVYYVDMSSNNGDYDVYPIWIIKGKENAGGSESEIQVFVDAQTGNEIIPWTQEL